MKMAKQKPMIWKQDVYTFGPEPTMTFTTYHLQQKPLRYFCNTGHVHDGELSRATEEIKRISGFNIANGIHCLTYYFLSHVRFPFHCSYFAGDGDFMLWRPDGQKVLLRCSERKIGPNGRLSEENINALRNIMKKYSDAVADFNRQFGTGV